MLSTAVTRRERRIQPPNDVPSPGEVRRGRAPSTAVSRHPREGAGARQPRDRGDSQDPSGAAAEAGGADDIRPRVCRACRRGEDRWSVLAGLTILVACTRQGKYEEADRVFRRAIDIAENNFGPGHPDVGSLLSLRASLLEKRVRARSFSPGGRRRPCSLGSP